MCCVFTVSFGAIRLEDNDADKSNKDEIDECEEQFGDADYNKIIII